MLSQPDAQTCHLPPAVTASEPRLLIKLPAIPASRTTSAPAEETRALLAMVMPLAEAPAVKPTPPARVTLPAASTDESIAIDSAPVMVTAPALVMPATPSTVPMVSGAAATPRVMSPAALDANVATTLFAPSVTSPLPASKSLSADTVLPAPCVTPAWLLSVNVLPVASVTSLSSTIRLKSSIRLLATSAAVMAAPLAPPLTVSTGLLPAVAG